MSATTSLPPGIVMRDLMLSVMSRKGLIFLIVLVVMGVSTAIALVIEPDYKARSTLLVLLGTEHTFRPAAGQQFMNSGGVDAEQVLRTEASILASDDLHRSVIRELELKTIYPKLLEPPGPVAVAMKQARAYVMDLFGTAQPPKDPAASDPLNLAVDRFANNLTITVDKKSSVIGLDFTHPNPQIAAQVLATLEKQYLELRAKLYGDVQAPIVRNQQELVGRKLSEADATLAAFKREHDISNFNDRRNILLRQQGDMEAALAKAEATMAEQQARVNQLNSQLAAVSGGKGNAAAALQGMVAQYRHREETAQSTYRGSPAVDEARRAAMERQTDIARMQSTQAYAIQTERNKSEADLRASMAGRDSIKAQLASLNDQINAVNGEEMQLHQLERNRGILEDNYKAVSKILDERQVVETVDANRQSSVRVIQPARVPAFPVPTRRLILLAGAVISILLSAAVVLLSHFFRPVYLRPEALEYDTGLTVLASVPESRALSHSQLLVGPA